MTRLDSGIGSTPPATPSGREATKVMSAGQSPTGTEAPGKPPKGLFRTTVSIVTDKMDERIAKLSEAFGDFKFTAEKHDTRHKIIVSGEKALNTPTLEQMRRVARSL